MSTSRTYLFVCVITLLALLVTGCATQKPISFAPVSCPADKSLVYVYWGHFFMKRGGLIILVNGKPKAILHSDGYYPLILDPGSAALGYSARISMYPIFMTKADSLQLLLKAGETYYVAYQPWSGWKPKLVAVDPTKAKRDIKDDTLSRGAE